MVKEKPLINVNCNYFKILKLQLYFTMFYLTIATLFLVIATVSYIRHFI